MSLALRLLGSNRLSERLLAVQGAILALTLEQQEGTYVEELRAQHRRLVRTKYGGRVRTPIRRAFRGLGPRLTGLLVWLHA